MKRNPRKSITITDFSDLFEKCSFRARLASCSYTLYIIFSHTINFIYLLQNFDFSSTGIFDNCSCDLVSLQISPFLYSFMLNTGPKDPNIGINQHIMKHFSTNHLENLKTTLEYTYIWKICLRSGKNSQNGLFLKKMLIQGQVGRKFHDCRIF